MFNTLFAFIVATSVAQFSSISESVQPVTIEGVIISAETGKPLSEAYVYIVQGEEEALTGANGAFRIVSWRTFPLTVTVRHANYEEKTVRLTAPPKNLRIALRSK